MENNKIIIGAVVVIIVSFVLFLIFSFFSSTEDYSNDKATNAEPTDVADETDRLSHIDRINAVHFFEDDEHIFVGEIDMPTPCDLLEFQGLVLESYPEQIRLEFTVLNTDTENMCAQVVTPQRFRIDVSASEDAEVTAIFNGRTVELNLLTPQQGDTPDDFELFIKG